MDNIFSKTVGEKSAIGQYLADIILGANDGIITTFVVVAGAIGASLSPTVILIIGFANVLGDATSMGFGNYLGQKSQADYYRGQRKREEREVEETPQDESKDVKNIFESWGFKDKDADRAVQIVTSDKKVWVDFMMREELGIVETPASQATKSGLVTFGAFVIAGVVPLVPFLVPSWSETAPLISTILAAIELFVIGSLRSLMTSVSWIKSGVEMLLVGALAGSLAYLVGLILERVVESLV